MFVEVDFGFGLGKYMHLNIFPCVSLYQHILCISFYKLVKCISFYASHTMHLILCISFFASHYMHLIICISDAFHCGWETVRPTLSCIELLLQLKILLQISLFFSFTFKLLTNMKSNFHPINIKNIPYLHHLILNITV